MGSRTQIRRGSLGEPLRRWAPAIAAAVVAAVAAPSPASAEFGVAAFDGQVTADGAGNPYTQAGGHPRQVSTAIRFNTYDADLGFALLPTPFEDAKTIAVDTPSGLIGNPRGIPTCDPAVFFDATGIAYADCPATAQIGVARLVVADTPMARPIYNLPRGSDDVAGVFGFDLLGLRVVMTATVGPAPDYRVRVTTVGLNQGSPFPEVQIRLWGTPASPEHDDWRCWGYMHYDDGCTGAVGSPDGPHSVANLVEQRPFLTLPTSCTPGGVGLQTDLRTESWQDPGDWKTASFESHLPPAFPAPRGDWGPPQGPTGCDKLPFTPSFDAAPTARAADGPTGLSVRLGFDQGAGLVDPEALVPAALKSASVRLPEGMSINASAADGLASCTDEQLGRYDTDPDRCPRAAKIGTARAVTQLLDGPLEGSVYVGSQRSSDPASGEMFRMFMVLEGPGARVKLVGGVKADPRDGRLVATFDNNPQAPVDEVEVDIRGGARAPLALPADCGTKTIEAELTSWAGHSRTLTDSFEIPCAGATGFDAGFRAGTVSPVAAKFSPFVAQIDRAEGTRYLSRVDVDLPAGMVAKLRGVEQCPDAVAAADTHGACPAGSRIGRVRVAAGSGSPFALPGDVYLTGPYKGAPYGMSIQVPAQAGPFDLGVVKVRQALHVDPETATVAVRSDPLPQVVGGVLPRLRSVDVDLDRDEFAVNPSSCAEKRVGAELVAVDGQVRRAHSRFQVGDCASLGFRPRMAMRLTGKRQVRSGTHPGLRTVVRQGGGQANIALARVTLPPAVVLDAENAYDPALVCGYDAARRADCPASSVIGTAQAVTPLLNRPLTGKVHLVQGIRFSKTGNRIRTTPSLLVKLRGEVDINLRGRTTVRGGRLVTVFKTVPDARVSRFALNVEGGRKGILVVTTSRKGDISLCDRRQTARVALNGHNGKRSAYRTTVKAPCGKAARRR